MSSPWTPTDEPVGDSGAADSVTLIDGTTFCISEPDGDIAPDRAQGLFVRDTRMLSRWVLTLDDVTPKLLAVQRPEPFEATYVSRRPPTAGTADSTLLVVRRRSIDNGMREHITLRNVGGEDASVVLRLRVEADFADLFEVKDGRAATPTDVRISVDVEGMRITRNRGRRLQEVLIRSGGSPDIEPGHLTWELVVAARTEWSTTVDATPVVDGDPLARRQVIGKAVAHVEPVQRLHEWRHGVPVLSTADPTLAAVLRRSIEDLGVLRIFDDEHPDRAVVAAGVPWFMALFGRDSLLTSWMLLPLDSSLATGTLQTLADHQGTTVDPRNDEQPGRILHEVRLGPDVDVVLGGRNIYYGSADATPLFVMLLGEVARWGGDADVVTSLLPAADRALEWIEEYGDADDDGFVEYQRASGSGLANQGWKDSWDAISFADGRIAEAPIALAEVQAYTYAAYRSRAHFARDAGDTRLERVWTDRADHLKQAFNDTFWLPEQGWYAVGLDREKAPIDALTSNIGHCLWTGIVDDDKAEAVADLLLSPDMFTGWGIRTLAGSMSRYNPMSYHNGSVWPHDNALIASGLIRYGFVEHAQRVMAGLLEAAEHFGHRLPELFCGFDRSEFTEPVPYPTSCSPQAWAAASPLLFLRSLLRLDPELPRRRISCDPCVPARYLPLSVQGVRVDGLHIGIEVARDGWRLTGLTDTDITLGPSHR